MMCISLTACSSDDDGPTEEQTEEQLQGMIQLQNLKMNLCQLDANGEPVKVIFGTPYSTSDPSLRAYYTKNSTTAKSRFKLLFNNSTPCSADGNTYTLANKQGTATFTEGDGEKGLLATADFKVPGLKGYVSKIYFIDANMKGTNADADNSQLKPGTLVAYDDGWDKYSFITLGQWESPYGQETVLLAPYIIRYTKPTPWFELALSNITAYDTNNPILEIIGNYTDAEYTTFCQQLLRLLSHDDWGNGDGYTTKDDFVTHTYTKWDGKSFFIQATYFSSCKWLEYVEKREYLLIGPDNDSKNRMKRYTIENNQLPEEFKKALPIATVIGEAGQNELTILE